MDIELVKQIIYERFSPDPELVLVEAQGNSYEIVVVSDVFEGLTPVKRQQRVYACLKEYIQTGELHAISMKTFTADQWRKEKPFYTP